MLNAREAKLRADTKNNESDVDYLLNLIKQEIKMASSLGMYSISFRDSNFLIKNKKDKKTISLVILTLEKTYGYEVHKSIERGELMLEISWRSPK